jgi:hypothetical protein
VYENLKPADELVISFPMVERAVRATLNGKTYTLRFRGNTMVGFSSEQAETGEGVRNSRMVLWNGGRAVAKGVTLKDAKVSVDAKSNAEAGIMLRWQDPANFLLAIYAAGALYFHEVVGGHYGQALGGVPARGFGENINLVAEVNGSQATVTLTDGTKGVLQRSTRSLT